MEAQHAKQFQKAILEQHGCDSKYVDSVHFQLLIREKPAWLGTVGDGWNTPAGRDIIWRSRSKQTPALLVKIINDKGLTEKDRARYFRSLDFITGPEKDAALVELVTAAGPK